MESYEDKEEHELLERLMQDRVDRELNPHVPPDYIVSGNCSFSALNRYLTLHPLDTIRAVEAMRMCQWMYPLAKAHLADHPAWDLHDIIGDNPGEESE